MRNIRIYQAGSYECGQSISLSPHASHHVAVVLRRQPGDYLTLFSGNNEEFSVCIQSISKKNVFVIVEAVNYVSRESPFSIHLAQAISKGDRMDFVIQKAVELGVSCVTPVISQHCAVRLDKARLDKKLSLWQTIAIGACEQSGRNWVPKISEPLSLETFIHRDKSVLKLILDPQTTYSWRDYNLKIPSVTVLIGPEGGLSADEIDQAQKCGFHSLSLGPRILRTETAAISILSVLQALGGDL